jgi:hypothetical protein
MSLGMHMQLEKRGELEVPKQIFKDSDWCVYY